MGFSVGDTVAVYGHKAIVRYVGTLPPSPGLGPRSSSSKKKALSAVKSGYGIEFYMPAGENDGSADGQRYFRCQPKHGMFVLPSRVQPYDGKECAAVQIQASWRSYRARQAFQDAAAFHFWNELDAFEEKDALVNNRDVGTPTLNTIKKQIHEQNMADEMEEMLMAAGTGPGGGGGGGPGDRSRSSSSSSSYLTVPGAGGRSDSKAGAGVGPSIAGGGVFRGGRRRSSARRSLCRSSVDASSISSENVPDDYTGPKLKWPITREFALDLVDHYRDNPDYPLPRRYALELIMAVEDHYKQTMKGAVVEVEIPKKGGSRLVLVGDTHGQLNDVLWIFYKFGPPSPTNVYLFNGDIADRGRYAVEIFMMLFAFKLQCPSSVIINRGNHESADMNEVYGFAQEVRQKYGGFVYQKFQEIFHLLPLCVVMEKRVFVVHGGLCRKDNITLQHIDKLNRQRPCPACPHSFEDTLMFDLLWSDPQHENGRGWSTRGADCIAFGPDVTDAFLTKNNLEVCIRSHQVPTNLRGFEPVHDGRCVTLFSASNYCGTTGNYGGVIIFEANLSFEIQEYMAPSLAEIQLLYKETCAATQKVFVQTRIKDLEMQTKRHHRRTAAARMNEQILEKICKMICEKKTDLWWCFFNMGAETGRVSPAQWREACSNVLGQDFPWVYLMKRLHVVDADGYVYYNDFLNRYRVEFRPPKCKHLNWRRECVARVFESIMSADLSLKETLMLFDRNCDGTVSFREFNELITELDVGLSEPQVRILMRLITASPAFNAAAGSIDVAEFLGRFRVVYSHVINDDSKKNVPWLQRALHCIGKAILADKADAANRHYEQQRQDGNLGPEINARRRSSAVRAVALFQKFKDYNEGGDGYLSYADFVTGIKRLPIDEEELGFALTDEHLYKVAEAVDTTGSKRINYLEFLQAFHVVDSNSNNSAAEELWGQICTAIYQHKSSIRRALHQFDPDMTGQVDSEDFRSALVTLNTVLSRTEAPLTEEQIDQLVNTLDLDEEGMVEYEEFLDSFAPVDTYFLQPAKDDDSPTTHNGPATGKKPLNSKATTNHAEADGVDSSSSGRRFTFSSQFTAS